MTITSSTADGVLTLQLDNPRQANALTPDMLAALTSALHEAAAEESLRGILLTAAGKGFSAGMHTAQFDHSDPNRALVTISALGEVCRAVRTNPLPVAVAMSGYCIGGALEIAAAADFRVAAPETFFEMPEVRIGIPSVLEAVNLPGLIGWTRTTELLLTGKRFTAGQMETYGFLNTVVADDEVEDVARGYLADCALSERGVIAQQKRMLDSWRNMTQDAAFADSQKEFALAFARQVDAER